MLKKTGVDAEKNRCRFILYRKKTGVGSFYTEKDELTPLFLLLVPTRSKRSEARSGTRGQGGRPTTSPYLLTVGPRLTSFGVCIAVPLEATLMTIERTPGDGIFLQSRHSRSGRRAFFEDDGLSAWLYLTATDSRKFIGDCWVYNSGPAPELTEIERFRPGPPPAAKQYTRDDCVKTSPELSDVKLIWSHDGNAVAVLIGGMPMGFIIAGQKRGVSRCLTKTSGWGRSMGRGSLPVNVRMCLIRTLDLIPWQQPERRRG